MNADKGIKIEDGRATCEDCAQWVSLNAKKLGKIVHSRRCDTPDAQYGKFMTTPVVATVERITPASPDYHDARYDQYKAGIISQSEAMNDDF